VIGGLFVYSYNRQTMLPANIKALILDMDGVIWKSDAPIGDLPTIFQHVRECGLKFVFATNNGTKTPGEYQTKLADLGIRVNESQIVTSAMGVAHMLSR
jgi:4-nitrophenyl phosphatase